MKKTVEYYLNLPYTRELIPEAEGGWFVRIKELPGCMTFGKTPEEALRMIDDAMRGWLDVELEDNSFIPEPREEEAFSGKFNTRVPKSLHRKIVEAADQEGVSLNQWINNALSEAVGEVSGRTLGNSATINQTLVSLNVVIADLHNQVSQLKRQMRAETLSSYHSRTEMTLVDEFVENTIKSISRRKKKDVLFANPSTNWNSQLAPVVN